MAWPWSGRDDRYYRRGESPRRRSRDDNYSREPRRYEDDKLRREGMWGDDYELHPQDRIDRLVKRMADAEGKLKEYEKLLNSHTKTATEFAAVVERVKKLMEWKKELTASVEEALKKRKNSSWFG